MIKPTVAALLLLTGVAIAVPTVMAMRSDDASPASTGENPDGTGTVTGSQPGSEPGAQGTGSGAAKEKDDKDDKDDKGVFAISGSVAELVPGTTRPLTITITNPNSWPIDVTSITTEVGSPGPGCPAGSLVVPEYVHSSGPAVTAPGKGSTTLTLTAQYVDSTTVDQTACKGATFPLTFSGTAEKATKK